MNRKELIALKRIVEQESEKRKKINKYLEEEIIQNFLNLVDIKKVKKYEIIDKKQILKQVLKNYTISETNGIYVCTDAFDYDQNPAIYINHSKIDSDAKFHTYVDIENQNIIQSCTDEKIRDEWGYVIPEEFETNNTILNPYNTYKKQNGYHEVRQEFFDNVIDYDQSTAKNMLLKKYQRLNVKRK